MNFMLGGMVQRASLRRIILLSSFRLPWSIHDDHHGQKISTPHLIDHISRVGATIRAPLDLLHRHRGLGAGAGVHALGAVTLPVNVHHPLRNS